MPLHKQKEIRARVIVARRERKRWGNSKSLGIDGIQTACWKLLYISVELYIHRVMICMSIPYAKQIHNNEWARELYPSLNPNILPAIPISVNGPQSTQKKEEEESHLGFTFLPKSPSEIDRQILLILRLKSVESVHPFTSLHLPSRPQCTMASFFLGWTIITDSHWSLCLLLNLFFTL